MNNKEQEHVMERIEQIDDDIQALQEHPLVDDYRAGECLGMARDYLEQAYQDVAHADEIEQ